MLSSDNRMKRKCKRESPLCSVVFEQHGPHKGFLLLIVKEVKLYHFSKIIFTYNSFCQDIYDFSTLNFFEHK